VDDNSTNRAILEKLLGQMSLQVESLDNGETALHHLRRAADVGQPYHMVLVDALMPGKDGFSVIEEINEDPDLVSTTVLMLSSADRSTFYDRTKNLAICGYLDKPVARRELLEVMCAARFGTKSKNKPPTESIMTASLNVLVVEDTPANQKVVKAILRKRGHSVSLANNGREAIDKVRVEPFDVVLMDVQMPTVDGYQATAAIREMDGSMAKIPIIAMTAHAMKGDANRCFQAGMNDYISKPINSTRLIQLVEQWGNRESIESETSNPTNPNRECFEEGTTVLKSDANADGRTADFDLALARLDGNRKLLADMIGFFREDAPQLLNEIESAIAHGDVARVKRAAHSMKGLAASFEAERVISHARKIERLAETAQLEEITASLSDFRAAISELEAAFVEFESE
jgi:CheY-like chemotaxis protein/HPt (histidine-containing phosphotransfer) domain-containing protein